MSTTFDNTSHSNAFISVLAGNNLIFGMASFWTQSDAITIVRLSGSSLFRNAGQVYADAVAVSTSGNSNRVEILPTGVISSSTSSAILHAGFGCSVINAGYVSGGEAIRFTGTNGEVINTGTLVGEFNTVEFRSGGSTDHQQQRHDHLHG